MKLWGETWYKTVVELPLKSTFQVYNGNEKGKHYLKLGISKVPIWGFGKIDFKEYETESNEKKYQFFKLETPSSFIHDTHREKRNGDKNLFRMRKLLKSQKKWQN